MNNCKGLIGKIFGHHEINYTRYIQSLNNEKSFSTDFNMNNKYERKCLNDLIFSSIYLNPRPQFIALKKCKRCGQLK